MSASGKHAFRSFATIAFVLLLLLARRLEAVEPGGEILEVRNRVQYASAQSNVWVRALVGQPLSSGDGVRTFEASTASLRLATLGTMRVGENTTVEILPPRETAKSGVSLKAGLIYFFSRFKPGEFFLETPQANGVSRGTEAILEVKNDGTTILTVLDGEVELFNPLGRVLLSPAEQGRVDPGGAPRKTAVIEAANLMQWWLYYPAVLDPSELSLNPASSRDLAESLAAYGVGDLPSALQRYPADRVPMDDAERLYRAGLLLSVGQFETAESILEPVSESDPLVWALRELVAAVARRPVDLSRSPRLASQWLARSYLEQSRARPDSLLAALRAARRAVELSPGFSFAWSRVGELEFAFGHVELAQEALVRALALAPRNAQALAIHGFVLSARNRLDEASHAFDRAIEIDPGLGNAWLGRGLCGFRRGDVQAGLADLQTAAVLEPNRSLLRSYLGKGLARAGDDEHAEVELSRAAALDPNDPTPALYSALLEHQSYRFNEAVRDLERSLSLNDNRRVFRSQLLLDQDRAVRGSSLARLYQSAGLVEAGYREAARALSYDQANYSAHLFLADSLNALRDPTRFNLRYETAWFNELLLANLLAPAGAGTFSQNISLQEYARLFESDRFGLNNLTELRSDGQFRQVASQYGTWGQTSYSLDLDYQMNEGVRPNNELSRLEWYTQIKQQLAPRDSVLLLTKYQDYRAGDNFQYFDPPSESRAHYRFDESQAPIALAGYHHEWSPGHHTLFLGGRLESDQRFSDDGVPVAVVSRDAAGNVAPLGGVPLDWRYHGGIEIYTAELSHILETPRYGLTVGARYQSGEFKVDSSLVNPPSTVAGLFPNPPASAAIQEDFDRFAPYLYYTLKLFDDQLALGGGLAYDRIRYPENFRAAPLTPGGAVREQWSPKASLVWAPRDGLTVRGMYSQSLGGASLDESFRLEPVQLAGFTQGFRTILSESIGSSVSAPSFEVGGLALDLKFKTSTYVGFELLTLRSDTEETIGAFEVTPGGASQSSPASVPKRLDYSEQSAALSVGQLLADDWSLGASYKWISSDLETDSPAEAAGLVRDRADLHRLASWILFNHPSGFFARAESLWCFQDNSSLPNETLHQLNLLAGFRLPRRKGELAFGILNVTDQDYRLNPLNPYFELPRQQVFMARLKFLF